PHFIQPPPLLCRLPPHRLLRRALQPLQHAILVVTVTVVTRINPLINVIPRAPLAKLRGLLEELLDSGKLLRRAEVAVARAAAARIGDVDNVAVKVRHFGRVLSVIGPAELHNSSLPMRLLPNELVDLVVEVAQAVFTQTLVLNLRHLPPDLAHDLLAPLVGLRKVAALRSKERTAFLRLLLLLRLHRDEAVQHRLRLLLVSSHF
ncbi:hypothetical protein V8G54_035821, partial [Vigna mungo]